MSHIIKPAAFDPLQEMRVPGIEIRYCLDEDSPTVDIHSHTHYELYLFCEGDLDRYVVGSRSYRLQRGDLLLIPPMTPHHPIFQAGARRYQRFVLWFSRDYLDRLTELDPDISSVFRLCREREDYMIRFASPELPQALEGDMQSMWAEAEGGAPCRSAALHLSCMRLLVRLNRGVSANAMVSVLPGGESPLMDQVIAYIHEHYSERLSLQSIAEKFFVSQSTIEHLFTQKLGLSFYRYVTKWRIAEAKTQIAASVPIKIACQNCGYEDYSNFYKAFIKETGLPPSRYRRSLSH